MEFMPPLTVNFLIVATNIRVGVPKEFLSRYWWKIFIRKYCHDIGMQWGGEERKTYFLHPLPVQVILGGSNISKFTKLILVSSN